MTAEEAICTFNTMDELVKFIEKYGDIVIYNGTYIKEIVIYDDYIE